MALLDVLFGRRLASAEDRQQRVSALAGVAVFGLDALGSAAYGPEAALTVLIPLGLAGLGFSLPILSLIVVLLIIVFFSYRQTIAAYPRGAGSYTVAKENLGEHTGLLAAVALMIDYALNTAVGISSGVNALISAVPALQPYALCLCLTLLSLLTYINLRGVRESARLFLPPTALFVLCLGTVLVIGIVKIAVSGGHPQAVEAPPPAPGPQEQANWWLLVRAFAAGCTAMTGVEAVSNGIQAFKEPVINTARRCLSLIVVILAFLLLGVALLLPFYHIIATEPGKAGYQSLLSMVTAAVCGRGLFYYLTIIAILAVLSLSANTSFADFPRLCQRLAHDGFLPYGFGLRGRRLVFTEGICVLALVTVLLLVLFNGVTDRLIPLFAVGAFGTFTLSQAGMVRHWLKGPKRSSFSALINGLGASATGITLLIIVVAKFSEGAWLVVILLPCLYGLMWAIKRHSAYIARAITRTPSVNLQGSEPPIAVVFVDSWNCVAQKALQTAYTLTHEVEVLHVEWEDAGEPVQDWQQAARRSISEAKLPPPKLVSLKSPYRRVVSLIVEHVWRLERDNPGRLIAVLVPELVDRWYVSFLNNQRAAILRTFLLLNGHSRVLI
ncbi:MAG: APC family permease, partial [Verrucomicrobia bacterium]|nr:APC family permease [Verrucomicrobiota bacterium]